MLGDLSGYVVVMMAVLEGSDMGKVVKQTGVAEQWWSSVHSSIWWNLIPGMCNGGDLGGACEKELVA